MDITAEYDGGQRITLNGRLEFDTAVTALDLVCEQITRVEHMRVEHLTVDLAGIIEANSAALALMAEWMSLAQASGKTINFQNVPQSLLKIAEICQLEYLLAS